MSNPVDASQGAPLFGGLSGYRRPALGRPTSVPTGAPAFRGRTNNPGSSVAAPTIRTSYNRDNRGTNVCVPYSRIVPLNHLHDVGRISPGDVVFCSRFTVGPMGHDIARETRIVGVDWLNRELGGNKDYDGEKHVHNWQVGHNVLLGPTAILDPKQDLDLANAIGGYDETNGIAGVAIESGDLIADEWRSLKFLREWACDGVVLSNDTPHCHQSTDSHDGQLFNIAVQGVCAANNGFGANNTLEPAP